jgi:lysophospholipase L1-like esterase
MKIHKLLPYVYLFTLSLALTSTGQGGSQMFPSKLPSRGLNAYLISPMESCRTLPEGWSLRTEPSFGNSAIADLSLDAAVKNAVCRTTSYRLPRSDYHVSILVRGRGQVRLVGSDRWTDFETPRSNYYAWIEAGRVPDAEVVRVEVRSTGGRNSLNYGGILAEGQVQPVHPVSAVAAKIAAGQPVTVVLLGDSVTENFAGTGGGSSRFETGNPGLLLHFLKGHSDTDVDYFAHRLPQHWPADRDPAKIPLVEVGGQTCYDSRIEADSSKPIHLINLGKGGAAASYGWTRMPDTIIEADYFDASFPREERKPSVRFGLAHYRPDLAIINFGTNDVNAVHEDWTVEDYLFHMKTLATNIQHRCGAAVILSTPHRWTRGVHLASHRQPAMVDALRAYCRTTGIALADVYNEYEPGQYDGIHPGDAGHQHMANAYIKAILGQPSEPKIRAQTTAEELQDHGDGRVSHAATGLTWSRSADLADGEVDAAASVRFVSQFNADKRYGHNDWRLPTRDEMLRLVDPTNRSPALPTGHPFQAVSGWYRTSTPEWGVDMNTGTPWSSSQADGKPARIWLVRGPEGE